MTLVRSASRTVATGLLLLAALGGCAPLIVGGAMLGGSLMATDRRTTGAQIEDRAIELKAGSRLKELATLGHVNVHSYNRMLLITGEVPGEAERGQVEQAIGRLENVKAVVNELAVMGNSSTTARYNDTLLYTKVRASLLDAKDVMSNAIKVVTERSTVYLMGRVTEREATRAADLARQVPGVQKVVRVFELVSEDELARIQPPPAK